MGTGRQMLWGLVGLLAALGLMPTTPALGQATTTTTSSRSLIIVFASVDCNGITDDFQEGDLTGEVHIVTHTTIDANGVTRVLCEANARISGVGPQSGLRYWGGDRFTNRATFLSTGTAQFSFVDTFVLHREGTIGGRFIRDQLLTHLTMRVTVDANGQVTTTVENVQVKCVG